MYALVDDKTNDDIDRHMYHHLIGVLKDHGYAQYEISNFSKMGYACVHNMIYWQGGNYIGLGINGHSYLNGCRYSNIKDMTAYMQRIHEGDFPISERNPLTHEDLVFEYIMLALRLVEGLSISKFKERFHEDFLVKYQDILETLLEDKLCYLEAGRLKLTLKGMDLSNQVF